VSDINTAFCRSLLSLVLQDIRKVTTTQERKDAWVINVGRDHWEFHGPALQPNPLRDHSRPAISPYYWHGSADNAADARAKGWSKWWAALLDNHAALRARLERTP
jgi:hypothetical protein